MKLFSTILLSFLLAFGPVANAQQAVQAGGWPDGTEVVWQCQKGAAGIVKFIFKTPDGTLYAGAFSCGEST